jgi:adenylate cyclase
MQKTMPISGPSKYDRLLENVFALQDEITMCVVGAIEPTIRRAELDRVKRQRPDTFDAYDLLLRSQQFVFAGMRKEAAKAIPLLEEAVKLEPDYSAAHERRAENPSDAAGVIEVAVEDFAKQSRS